MSDNQQNDQDLQAILKSIRGMIESTNSNEKTDNEKVYYNQYETNDNYLSDNAREDYHLYKEDDKEDNILCLTKVVNDNFSEKEEVGQHADSSGSSDKLNRHAKFDKFRQFNQSNQLEQFHLSDKELKKIVIDLLKPILSEWVERNLPQILKNNATSCESTTARSSIVNE